MNPPEKQKKKGVWLATFSGNALLITILAHFLFGVAAVYLVVAHFQKKHINFQAAAPPSDHNDVEHKVQVAKKNDTESAPPDLKRITTTDVAAITVPDVPDAPMPDDANPTEMGGVDGVMGSGTGEGNGTGGSGNPSTPFGSFDEPAKPEFVGTLIDLKQTVDRKPTNFVRTQYHQTLMQFVAGNWDPQILAKFYKASKTLYASCIFISTLPAGNGPKAFGVEGEVQPNMYVVLYKVTASPTQDGTYHFIGMGDDILVVRADDRTVLDGSLLDVDPELRTEEKRLPVVNFNYSIRSEMAGMYVGPALHLKAGQPVQIQVLIGEEPGGVSNYFLYCQRDESTYDTMSNGQPLPPVFKLDSNPVQPESLPPSHPPFSTKLEPWTAVNPDQTGFGL